MAKRGKNGQTTIIIAIIAIVGVAVALLGFHRSKQDKTQRAMWSGLSNLGWPASEYLTHVDLGGVGDDIRYTINSPSGIAGIKYSSSRETGDPNWLDLQFKPDAVHGMTGHGDDMTMEHAPTRTTITTPDPISVKPVIVSAPKVGSNHETVGGNFLNKRMYPGIIP